jgi:predicted ATP-dependent endonuclease of OLD family
MISLFARMYLYPKKKIVLIDEPELSLSIDWQRGILIDVLLSPQCEQVIAITHSPFVFDNSLEPFARTLKLEVAQQEPELDLGESHTEENAGD